jgi:Cd2+/Zn2+-exporting ATPase
MSWFTSLSSIFDNPARRRQALALLSGSLIAVALVLEHLLNLPGAARPLMFAAAVIAGSDIAVRAVKALRRREISIELLVTLATGGALVIGEYWEAAAVTFLFLFGAYLEARTLARTRHALQKLLQLAPATALVQRGGKSVEVAAHEVLPGETVMVRPGTRIPVDGEVLGGHAAVDESPITGESMPVEKEAGARVFAGTISQNGLLHVRATGIGADTTLARIIRRVEEAQEARAPTQRFIERFARWYTPAIIGLSVVAYVLSRDLDLALTLLVIGCPGALVISTPVSVVAGIGRAAQHGVLIKGGEFLENAGKISAVALDKTGTLTEGRPRLAEVVALQPEPVAAAASAGAVGALPGNGRAEAEWDGAQASVLRWAAIAEAGSEHPLARPIVAAAQVLGPIPTADEFDTFPGRGVQARYAGCSVTVGTLDFMRQLGVPVDEAVAAHLARLKEQGQTAVLVSVDGGVIGALGIADGLRAAAPEMVRRLKRAGVRRVVMLTGDDPRTAQAIARQAGVDEVHAGLLPEQKLEEIRRLQSEGHVVAMLGDGVNDAPALAAAEVGIAMGAAGTDIAIETADIALMSDDLLKVPEAVRLSRRTLGNIRQNVAVALVTVAALLAGVLLGRVHMSGGMLIHELSVLVVIGNAMRLMHA